MSAGDSGTNEVIEHLVAEQGLPAADRVCALEQNRPEFPTYAIVSLGIPVVEPPQWGGQVQLWKRRPELRPMAAAQVQSLDDVAVSVPV